MLCLAPTYMWFGECLLRAVESSVCGLCRRYFTDCCLGAKGKFSWFALPMKFSFCSRRVIGLPLGPHMGVGCPFLSVHWSRNCVVKNPSGALAARH